MRKQQGQTLVEVLIALSVAGIVVTAITFVVISSLNNAEYSKNQASATQYAQQGLEIVKNQRYSDFITYNGLSGTYCLADGCTALNAIVGDACGPVSAKCTNNPNVPASNSVYIRQVSITPASPICTGPTAATQGGTQVSVIVTWTDSHCNSGYCHQVNDVSCITNYDQIPIP